MKWLKVILFYSNLYIALGAALACFHTVYIFGLQLPFSFYAFIASATLCSYSIHWYYSPSYSGVPREQWSFEHKKILLALAVMSALSSLVLILFLSKKIVLLSLPLVLASIIYTAPKVPQLARLRSFVKAKTIYLAMAWLYAMVLFPLWASGTSLSSTHTPYLIYSFVMLLLICGLFDYRDRLSDSKSGLHTLIASASAPVVMWLVQLLLSIATVANLHGSNYYGVQNSIVHFLPIVILLVLHKKIMATNDDWWYYGLVDAMIYLAGMVSIVEWIIRRM